MPSTIPMYGTTKKTKRLYRCQRCGGQVLFSPGDISCLQCGASHTKEGKLATYSTQELSNFLPRYSSEVQQVSEA